MTQRKRLLLILFYSTLVNTTCMGARVDVPLHAIELGASTLTVGVLMSLFGLLPALLSVHTGRWIDRVGMSLPMIVSSGAMAACLIIVFLLPSLGMLFAFTTLFALTFSVFNLSAYAAVAVMGTPGERTSNFAWLSLTGGVANFVGPVITGYLIDGFGHAIVFGLLSIPPAGCALAIFAQRSRRPARAAAASRPGNRTAFDLMRQPRVVGPLIAGALMSLGFDVYAFLVPVYGKSIGLSAASIGNIIGAMGLTVMLVRLLMPYVTRLFSAWQLVVGSQFLTAAVFMLFPFASAVAVLIGLSLLYGLTYGTLQPVLTALLANAAPAGRGGEALGLRFTMQNAMHAVIPALFGAAGALLGTAPVFLFVGGLMIAGGWVSQARWRKLDSPTSAGGMGG